MSHIFTLVKFWNDKVMTLSEIFMFSTTSTAADPGFPMGGHQPCRGAPTPEAATFRKFCMSKRKNLDL